MNDRERIERYRDDIEDSRGAGRVFVGRELELAHIVDRYKNDWAKIRRGEAPKKGISLIMGPPGSGKTSLLDEAEKRLNEQIAKDFKLNPRLRPLVFQMGFDSLRTKEDLYKECAEIVRQRQRLAEYAKPVARAAIRAVGGGAIGLDKIVDDAEELKNLTLKDRPLIVLLVDEIQNSGPENKGVYDALHNARFPQRIIPIFAGLSNSLSVLDEDVGVSRIEANMQFRLQSLEPEEAKTMFEENLEYLKIAPQPRSEWLEAAETEALCFPRHINVMVLATIDEALKMGQGPFHLDGDALERVKEATKNGRNDYYRSRLGGFESREIQVAKDVVQSIRRGDGDAIESARRGLERAMGKEAEGNVAKALVREMTRKGMLRIDAQGRYTEGIPSFCDWLLAPPETTQPGKAPETTKTFLWKVGFRNDDGTRHEYTIESTSAPGAVEKLLVTGFADDIGREPRENDQIYVDNARYILKYEDGKLSPRAATPPEDTERSERRL